MAGLAVPSAYEPGELADALGLVRVLLEPSQHVLGVVERDLLATVVDDGHRLARWPITLDGHCHDQDSPFSVLVSNLRTSIPAFAAKSVQWVAPRDLSLMKARHKFAPRATIPALRMKPADLP